MSNPRFSQTLIRAARGGDAEAMETLSSSVLGALDARERSAKAGESHLIRGSGAISDPEAGTHAYLMLRACESHGMPPPTRLVDLMQRLLGQDHAPGQAPQESKRQLARDYLEEHPGASIRKIARASGAGKSTVHEWRKVGII
ncbi:MAG: hypothetical protein IH994_11645 [Proteobacteria bacterium]|nr:hypothetical protein [Pseudomonadota bacterium]